MVSRVESEAVAGGPLSAGRTPPCSAHSSSLQCAVKRATPRVAPRAALYMCQVAVVLPWVRRTPVVPCALSPIRRWLRVGRVEGGMGVEGGGWGGAKRRVWACAVCAGGKRCVCM